MRELKILMVDDDVVDVQNVERALRRRGIGNPLYVARDGVEALDLLLGREGHIPLGAPRLILLDLNMPRMDGFEFLAELRSHREFEDDPVFVLTTSEDPRHEAEVQRYGVSGYIVKDELPLQALDLVFQGLQHMPPAELHTADVGELVRGVAAQADPERRLKLVLPGSVLLLETATARLEEVLRCLVENAVEHHDEPMGILRVSWDEGPEHVVFRVADDGPGIPEAHARDVFKPLYSTKAEAEPQAGVGMGLARVRQIVAAAGGRVEVEPGGGRGTSIRFSWPLTWPEPEELPAQSLLPIDEEDDADVDSAETVEDRSEPHERIALAMEAARAALDAPEPGIVRRGPAVRPVEEPTGGVRAAPPLDPDALDAALAAGIEDATSEVEAVARASKRAGRAQELVFTRIAGEEAEAVAPPPGFEVVEPAPAAPAEAAPAPALADALAAFEAPAGGTAVAEVEELSSAPLVISPEVLAAFTQEEPVAPAPAPGAGLPFVVLLVDDDEVDAAAIERALRRRGHGEHLLVATDADQALHVLRGAGGRTTLGPVVALVDLSLPGPSGFELIQQLRADDALCGVPVFVLSGAHDPAQRALATRLGAAGFIDKDRVGPGFDAVVELLEAYGRAVSF